MFASERASLHGNPFTLSFPAQQDEPCENLSYKTSQSFQLRLKHEKWNYNLAHQESFGN